MCTLEILYPCAEYIMNYLCIREQLKKKKKKQTCTRIITRRSYFIVV